jgi:Protein of unknown function (DUF2637)
MTTAPAHANGRALVPLPVHDLAPAWLQRDGNGHARTVQDSPEPSAAVRRGPDGTAFIVVALFAVAQVAVVAFSGSWQHQYELSVHLGQAHWVAGMQPLSVEGLIASATLVIWYAARYGHGVPLGAYLVLAAGVGQTVLMNVGADYRWPWLGPEISVWPAVAFVAAYEMAVWLVRKRQDGTAVVQPPADKPADSGRDKPADKTRDKPAVTRTASRTTKLDKAAAAIRSHPGADNAEVAAIAGVSAKTVQRARNGSTP